MSVAAVPLVAFATGGQHFVLDVMRVRELLRSMPLVPAPGSAPWMLGHMVLRGEVLPVLSLQLALSQGLGVRAIAAEGAQYSLREASTGRPTHILVLDVSGHSLGLVVDRVNEVLRLPAAALRPDLGPQTLRSPVSFGICDVRGIAHVLLDVRPLLALTAHAAPSLGGGAL